MKKFLVAAVVLATVFAFAACGGGKKSKPDVEVDDSTAIEDSDNDSEAVVPDGGNDDEENDVDSSQPGGNDGDSNQPGGNDGDPGMPDNDTPSGSDPCDPNPCTEPNKTVCTATGNNGYTCSCDRLTCEINGACIPDRDRNPANSCEECNRDYSKTSWSLVADGKDCEAKAGLMGSGTCRSGVCGGFGTCDNRAYGLKAGSPCNKDVECETGYCYTWYDYSGSGTYSFVRASVCTGACKEDEDCPNNMTCQFMESRGYQCMPLFVAGVERPNPKMQNFGPCNVDEDCEGGLCLSYGEGESFCSSKCTKSVLGGDDCGSCGRCKEDGATQGFKYEKYCVPKGSGELGDHCQSNMDCESGGCYDGYCTVSCSGFLGSAKCTGTYECMEDVYAQGYQTCIDSTRFNLPDGSSCNYDNQCASGECIEFEGDMFCGSHCVDTQVTDPETGAASTEKTCENGSQCLAVKKVNDYGNTYAEYICAQDKMLKRMEFGEDCYSDWQCEDGYTCFSGYFCSKACTEDSQCPIDKTCYIYGQKDAEEEGGEPEKLGVCISKEQQNFEPGRYCPYVWSCEMCYEDHTVQQYYCTKECEKDSDCFDIGGCYNGICQKAIPYRSDIYAACRFDDDCEKYTNCEHGMCTSDCSTDSECDGFKTVVPKEGTKTCMPCETNTDCKKTFYDYGSCVTDYDGNKFCLEDCSDNYTLCPEGTRCNGSYCYPISGSCKGGKAYCNSESNCAVPTLLDDWICRDNRECYSGKCYDSYCQTNESCSTDDDCGCGFKECKNGNCVPKQSLGTLEVEPNDTFATAQEVTTGLVFAGFGHFDNVEDFDYFKFKAKAGDYLRVITHPYCSEKRADTFITLFDSDGVKLGENEDMDYSYFASQYYYSEIMDVEAPANSYYYVMVKWSSRQAPYNLPYILEVNTFTPVAHNVCEGAKELEPGNYEESMKHATDSLDTKSCSGYYGYGQDLFYKVRIPAGKMMTFKVTPKSASFDPTISVISGCGEIADVCLAGNSFGDFGNPEEIVYYNDSESDKDYIVVVDSVVAPLEYDFSISLEISDAPAVPENDGIDGVTPLEGRGSLQGYTVSANDDFSPAQGICNGGTFTGKDVVYSMDMAAGDYFHAAISASFAAAIYVVKADEPDSCLYGGGLINFETDETTAGLYYLVIDSTNPSDYGAFSMTYIKEQADKDACKGLCTSSYRMCLPDKSDICMCDSSLGILYPSNCDSYCASEGGISGSCETTYKADGVTIDRNGGICTFDCTDTAKVAELCSDYTPSNCTCGSSDVCSWKNNGSCDKMCSDFFPSDHFDDSADCG